MSLYTIEVCWQIEFVTKLSETAELWLYLNHFFSYLHTQNYFRDHFPVFSKKKCVLCLNLAKLQRKLRHGLLTSVISCQGKGCFFYYKRTQSNKSSIHTLKYNFCQWEDQTYDPPLLFCVRFEIFIWLQTWTFKTLWNWPGFYFIFNIACTVLLPDINKYQLKFIAI